MNSIPTKTAARLSVAQLHLIMFSASIILTILLYLHGGATNPFVSLYLVPIAISAATLSIRFTVALATFCLLAYSALMFYYHPLHFLSPGHEMVMNNGQHSMHMTDSNTVNWHIAGMWLNFVLSTLLISYFVLRMARALRSQDAELSAIREKQLRDEQLLGIATLAAGTLHELGTPLATMTLLTEDLQSNAAGNPTIAEDAKLLAEQLARCRTIVHSLARAAEQPSDQLQRVPLVSYLDKVLGDWQLLQPAVPVQKQFEHAHSFIRVDSTFEQALINLLNNAAEASPNGIDIFIGEAATEDTVTISILDHGTGIRLDTASLGKPFASTRGPGRGLGLFLSNASIERLGGKVMLQSHSGGGTLTTVTLPVV
jgi:two-component system, sensor histidine kinase RegB